MAIAIGRAIEIARAIVMDGSCSCGDVVAVDIGGPQREALRPLEVDVLADGNTHEERQGLMGGGVAVGGNGDRGAGCDGDPGRAVEVLELGAGVLADGGSAGGKVKEQSLPFHGCDREDGIGAAFIDVNVVDGESPVVVSG